MRSSLLLFRTQRQQLGAALLKRSSAFLKAAAAPLGRTESGSGTMLRIDDKVRCQQCSTVPAASAAPAATASSTCSSSSTSASPSSSNVLSRKPAASRRLNRDMARGGKCRLYQTDANGLRKIPGVGPKTASLLHDQGIASVEQLNEKLMQEEVSLADADQIVDFLQEQVGVRHRRHASLIAEYVMENLHTREGPPVTVSIEGNISVGKSTLIRHMQASKGRLSAMTEFVLEPVERWQDVRGHNILEAFYENPERYAYTFQSFVFLTRLLEGGLTPSHLPQRLLERSVFSDSMVFLRAIHNAQWLSEMEFELLTTYFSPLCRKFPQIVPNGFIYLRADPETCFRRLQGRNRSEESTVSLPYLEQIHQYHEQWFEPSPSLGLGPGNHNRRGIVVDPAGQHGLDGMERHMSRLIHTPPHPDGHLPHHSSIDGQQAYFNTNTLPLVSTGSAINGHTQNSGLDIPELIRDNVVYLRGRDGFSVFEQIPTLVLDCDEDTSLGATISSSSGVVVNASAAADDAAWNERFARHAVMVECFFNFLREHQAAGSATSPVVSESATSKLEVPQVPAHNGDVQTGSMASSLAWQPDDSAPGRRPHSPEQDAARRLLASLVGRSM